jgi:hypothetical protein
LINRFEENQQFLIQGSSAATSDLDGHFEEEQIT